MKYIQFYTNFNNWFRVPKLFTNNIACMQKIKQNKSRSPPPREKLSVQVLRVLIFNESRDGILFFENKTFTPLNTHFR